MILKKPVMGFNTWNTFAEDINEQLIIDTVDKMVSDGYRDAGYEYVIIDDCWAEMKRNEKGELVPDHNKFPHGMKYLADYIHSKGMKFGMYSDAGFYTCAGYPASFGYEMIDAKTFASWEIDYLKYDFGYFPENAEAARSYMIMAQALKMTGRDIVFAICTAGQREPHKWARARGGHTYRSTDDILDSKESYRMIAESQFNEFAYSSQNCFNDMDMLTVGMFGKGHVARDSMTYDEYENHFLIWAFMSTPLIIGGDIRNMDEKCKELLLNKEVIKINQDKECRPPFMIQKYFEKGYVMGRMLENGDIAILAVNFYEENERQKIDSMTVAFDDIGIRTGSGYGFQITNVLTGENLGIYESGYAVKVKREHTVLLRAKPVKVR